MAQSPCWESNTSSAGQEIPALDKCITVNISKFESIILGCLFWRNQFVSLVNFWYWRKCFLVSDTLFSSFKIEFCFWVILTRPKSHKKLIFVQIVGISTVLLKGLRKFPLGSFLFTAKKKEHCTNKILTVTTKWTEPKPFVDATLHACSGLFEEICEDCCFWDIMSCSVIESFHCSRGTSCFHLRVE